MNMASRVWLKPRRPKEQVASVTRDKGASLTLGAVKMIKAKVHVPYNNLSSGGTG